jgi:hypothetical protein
VDVLGLQEAQDRAGALGNSNGQRNRLFKEFGGRGLGRWASGREIDRRENNNELNGKEVVKTFAVSRPGSFGRIRLRQTGLNHDGNNLLVLCAFELFGGIAALQ